ncbi:hypothetical protein OAK66_03065 [Candidatus Nitrosopelagicus sp.]|nr:hypothetical protein [Candidatus Nitrosopelagicus sp.]MDC0241393.1 hypothetical protein [Candidatus Nitrosopelagicus sp.]
MQKQYYPITSYVFIFTLSIVLLNLTFVIFPAFLIANIESIDIQINPFEIGNNAPLLLTSNIILFLIWYIHSKQKFTSFSNFINNLQTFDISKKIAILVGIVILIIYSGFTIPELFIDESTQFADYQILVRSLDVFPNTDTDDIYVNEQNSRYFRMLLLSFSQEFLQNIKIIPFLSSLLLVIITALFTISHSKNNLSGIISMVILLQGFTFLEYDSIAVYENIWVLLFISSIFVLNSKWFISGPLYILSVLTKAFSAPFIIFNLFYVLNSDMLRSIKLKIISVYLSITALFIIYFLSGDTIYDKIITIDFNRFLYSLSDFSSQMRFDYILLILLLPTTIGLYSLAKNGIKFANSLLFFLGGLLLMGPLVALITDFYVILPYRFVPLLVFFSIAVALIFFRTPKLEDAPSSN